jgi:hypothetical protein
MEEPIIAKSARHALLEAYVKEYQNGIKMGIE